MTTTPATSAPRPQAATIAVDEAVLHADVSRPARGTPRGTVLFAHGSGSGRHSPRNRQVAVALNQVGLATVLADLLTEDEEAVDVRTHHLRFDIELLSSRMTALVDWAGREGPGGGTGLFGASTGAAAALAAAAARPEAVAAVVSRGGRPDLAGEPALAAVRAPTLLIVGGNDDVVLRLNQETLARLVDCEARLEVVAGASHLFEEPGTLDQVASLAGQWFREHLGTAQASP